MLIHLHIIHRHIDFERTGILNADPRLCTAGSSDRYIFRQIGNQTGIKASLSSGRIKDFLIQCDIKTVQNCVLISEIRVGIIHNINHCRIQIAELVSLLCHRCAQNRHGPLSVDSPGLAVFELRNFLLDYNFLNALGRARI